MGIMQERLSLRFIGAAFAGAKTPYPAQLKKIISNSTSVDTVPAFNPLPDLLLEEFIKVVEEINASRPPLADQVKKREILQYYSAFADSHNLEFPPYFSHLAQISSDIASHIEQIAVINGPLTLIHQLKIALELTQNNLTDAVGALAITTRALARGQDTRITPNLNINEERMKNWKNCLAHFGYNDELCTNPDPAGDTYHFWEAVWAGLRSQDERDSSPYNLLTAILCDQIYLNTAPITDILRHKLCQQKGETHSNIDILGYHIGRALWENTYSAPDSPNGTM